LGKSGGERRHDSQLEEGRCWVEKLPAQVTEKAEVTEAQMEQNRGSERRGGGTATRVCSFSAMEEHEEIEIDLDEIARPDHFTVMNQRIDEMLGREYLSPQDLKIAAEAKEAVLRAAAVYLEVLEIGSRL